jgi:hypothetical protein
MCVVDYVYRQMYSTAMRLSLIRDDRLTLPDGDVRSVARPVNDLLGLRDEERYLDWLEGQWGELAPSRESIAELIDLRDKLASIADETTNELGRIEGKLDYERLAPFLSQITYREGDIDVPSLAVLAAWALVREVERGVDVRVTCPSCGRPWFARGARRGDALLERDSDEGGLIAAYNCSRPAPGLTMTCAQLHAHDRFAREREDWNREYRKVMARKLRGSVSEEEFRAWRSVSSAGERGKDWTPFDEWRTRGGARAPERSSDG